MSFALAAIIFVISLLAVIAIAWTMRLLLVEGTPTPSAAAAIASFQRFSSFDAGSYEIPLEPPPVSY